MTNRKILINALCAVAEERGQLYAVGGLVRDALLNHPAADFDLVVRTEPLAWARALAARLDGGALVPLSDTPGEEAARLVWRGEQVDFAAWRNGVQSLEDDLCLRDFTINAMALPFADFAAGCCDSPLDPTGGAQDLRNQIIRSLPGTLADDPLRMVRAYRFHARLGFRLDAGTRTEVKKLAPTIGRAAPERISSELRKIFDSPRTSETIKLMAEDNLLRYLLPELYLAEGVSQPQEFHHLDVLEHSFLALKMAEKIIARPEMYFTTPEILAQVNRYLAEDGSSRRLKWAALLHDIGKPGTENEDEEKGHTTYYGHDQLSRKLFEQFAGRSRWSAADRRRVGGLIGMHMQPFHLVGARRKGMLSKKGALRFCRRAGGDLFGLFLVALSDTLAGNPKHHDFMRGELVNLFVLVEETWRNDILPITTGVPLLTGQDLIDMGFVPGPMFRKILMALDDARVEGEVKGRSQALQFARGFLPQEGL